MSDSTTSNKKKGIWSQLSDWWNDRVTKKYGLTPENHPTLFPIAKVFFILGLVLFVWAEVSFLTGLASPTQFAAAAIHGKLPATSTSSADSVSSCRKFNLSEWQTGQGSLIQDGDIFSVATSSPNGLLRYQNDISLGQGIKVTFVPHSDSEINFVMEMHNLYEIVIGDGNYDGITVKASPGDDQSMQLIASTDGRRRLTFSDGQMQPGRDITVVLTQGISRLGDGSYELNLTLGHTSYNNTHPQTVFATYSFPLPPEFSYVGDGTKFSLGLEAAPNRSKVAAEFLCVDFF